MVVSNRVEGKEYLLTRQWQRLSTVKTIIIHKMDGCVGTQEDSPGIELVAVRKQSSGLTESKEWLLLFG